MATQIQVRRDSSADWASNDPTLAEGELAYNTDTKSLKVGDGSSAYSALNAFTTSSGITAADVTYENLDANGDVGTVDNTVASGSHLHDDRYYTETEEDTWRNSVTQTEMGYLNGVSSDIQTQINTKATSADVTYENLDANGDIGTGANTVASGSHLHDDRYYTESEVDALLLTVSGTGILNVVEDTTPQLGGTLELNDQYIKLTQPPSSDHTFNGIVVSGTVDTVTAMDLVYLASDGSWYMADADNDTKPAMGMTKETDGGATAETDILLYGTARDDSWNWTVGGTLYLSTTGGEMTQTAPSSSGEVVQIVGFALTADTIFFNPNPVLSEVE